LSGGRVVRIATHPDYQKVFSFFPIFITFQLLNQNNNY